MGNLETKNDDTVFDMWDLFDSIMQEYGYTISIRNDAALGRGSLAYKNSDKWIPTITLHVWGSELSIHVQNRCGNSILNVGATIAIYKYHGTDMKEFEGMVEYAVAKWGEYNKSKTYIFTEGEDKEDRLEF